MRLIGIITIRPQFRLPFIWGHGQMKAYLTHEEVAKIEKAAFNLRDKVLVRILFHLGCRISEVPSLAVEDVDFGHSMVTIP